MGMLEDPRQLADWARGLHRHDDVGAQTAVPHRVECEVDRISACARCGLRDGQAMRPPELGRGEVGECDHVWPVGSEAGVALNAREPVPAQPRALGWIVERLDYLVDRL